MARIDEIKVRLINDINEELGINVDENENLLYSGLTSLSVMSMMSYWKKEGCNIKFSKLLKMPTVSEWAKIIYDAENNRKKGTAEMSGIDISKTVNMYEPFDMTDVQYAYWVGRRGDYLGGVGCHGYFEVNAKYLDVERLSNAWDILFEYHPMLRAAFTEDGKQVVRRDSYPGKFTVVNLSNLSDEKKHSFLDGIRENSSHRLMNIAEGEVFTLKVCILGDGEFRLHFDIDLLVCDVQSFRILLRDLANVYVNGRMPAAEKEWDFAKYLAISKHKRKEIAKNAEAYWKKKIEELPGAPRIYVKEENLRGKSIHFIRHEKSISADITKNIKKKAADHNSTLATVMLTAYGYVLSKWSENKKFLMNLPMFNRDTDEGIDDVVADFTNLLLVPLNYEKKQSFAGYLNESGEAFKESIDNSDYSGVKILRDLKKCGKVENGVPFVFSCNLGGSLVSKEFQRAFGDISYMISQTPQVILDFQLFDEGEGLHIVWDSVEEALPDGVLDEMFDCFINLIENLGLESTVWEELQDVKTRSQVRTLEKIRDFNVIVKNPETMVSGIVKKADRNPKNPAIICPDSGIVITRGELTDRARRVAALLKKKKLQQGDRVIVIADRKWETIASFIAVQLCGAAYIPVRPEQPEQRLRSIIKSSSASMLIHNGTFHGMDDDISTVDLEDFPTDGGRYMNIDASPDDTAYIIFTSGSTGIPKGVAISHKAAMNTISTINKMYSIGSGDVAIGVSSFDFDLSVYDIFGLLNAGGAYMMVPADSWRDATKWVEYAEKYKVTVWNSVPAIVGMFQTELEASGRCNNHIRRIFLSGDWCSLDMPEKLSKNLPNSKLTVMGGATEASIWSNYIDVELPVPKEWTSIPYGSALKNQMYRVVDGSGEDVPDFVSGELLIGGYGVAQEYVGDSEKTNEKFFDEYGNKWYRTGDMGRIWSDGTIEFLGRMDTQLKIRGHRIEAGEIEAIIKESPYVKDSIVMGIGDRFDKKLTAFILPGKKEISDKSVTMLRDRDFDTSFDKDFYELCRSKRKDYLKLITDAAEGDGSYRDLGLADKVKGWKEELESKKDEVFKNLVNDAEREQATFLDKFMKPFAENYREFLFGGKEIAEIVTSGEFVSPGEMMERTEIGRYSIERIVDVAKESDIRAEITGNNLRILEVGIRSTALTRRIKEELPDAKYTVLEESGYYLAKAKEAFKDISDIEYIQGNIENSSVPEIGIREFDLIIFNNTLHQMKNITDALRNASYLLDSNGLIVYSEMTEMFPLADVSIELFGKEYTDIRKTTKRMVLTKKEWVNVIEEHGFDVNGIFPKNDDAKGYVFIAQADAISYETAVEDIKDRIHKALPSYMEPDRYIGISEMPISANGKQDRKKLELIAANREVDNKRPEKLTDTENKLAALWESILGDRPGASSNFFGMGGDSLLATRLVIDIRSSFGTDFSIEKVFSYQTLSDMAEYIDQNSSEASMDKSESEESFWIEDEANKYEPFELTDVQQAYWLGRTEIFRYGGMSTQCFFEMKCKNLDIVRAEDILNRLISAYDTLRTVVLSDGQHQKTLETVDRYNIKTYDYKNMSESEKTLKTEAVRNEISHRQFEPEVWPMFDIRYVDHSEDTGYLMIDFDNILMDGWSMFYFMKEWKALYDHPENEVLKPDISFRDYMMTYKKISESGRHDEDMRYWMEKINEVYPAPELPVKNIERRSNIGFKRFKHQIKNDIWNRIKKTLKDNSITPAVFLLSAYAEVLSRWSNTSKFSINLTNFNRHEFHKGVNRLLGDFTALTIHGIDMDSADSFIDRTAVIQKKMWQDLNHSYVSGVEIERYLNKIGKNGMMPIVYTCGLGLEKGLEREYNGYLGEMMDGLSYTPQVWLDNQVSEEKGDLIISWDMDYDLFPGHMAEDMFEAYVSFIEELSCKDELWFCKDAEIVDVRNDELIRELNSTDLKLPKENMLTGFRRSVAKYPDKLCIRTVKEKLTYKEVDERSDAIADQLIEKGITEGDIVAIKIKKGANQIIAAIAILKCNAAYLPLKHDNPYQRNKDIIELSNTAAIIIAEDTEISDVMYREGLKVVKIGDLASEVSSDKCRTLSFEVKKNREALQSDLAYIIYTSGTTGVPKGVAITHGAAMNTILDINRRIDADSTDGTIQISDLSFDLSVYDIFGMLSVGGSITVPEQEMIKEPSAWVKLLEESECTIWNSVPMYVQMLTEYLSCRKGKSDNKLRAVLMSGDWIPLNISKEIRNFIGDVDVYGLGGATECSIWSNIFKIEDIKEDWVSIPYGKPLANQRYYIYDGKMRPRPSLVPGDLYIAGRGLALCYWNDEKVTNESFIVHPKTGERLYRTGDKALYMEDGNIQFCGREDSQVKLNGFRIELGEIDNHIKKDSHVKNCISIVDADRLYSFVTADGEIDTTGIIQRLKEYLPAYMVPSELICIEEIPISSNGKVDRKKLVNMISDQNDVQNSSKEDTNHREMNETELKISVIWKEILGADKLYPEADFISMGGDSLAAVKMANEINEKFNIEISLADIYSNATIEQIAAFIQDKLEDDEFGEI